MVDIHCHLLPNVDDGPTSWELSLEMCRIAWADGITHIVATPHANHKFRFDREAFCKLLKKLSDEAPDGLKLSLGCDFHLSYENLVDALAHPARYSIAETNYILVELSDYSVPPSVEDSLRKLLSAGLLPVVTHPERNLALQGSPSRILKWIDDGCLIQVTANSLTGGWGRKAYETAEWLLKRSAVHVLASDAHGIESRPPLLSEACRIAGGIVGKSKALALVEDTPRAIVSGRSLTG